jgi:hypothetical protein
MKIIPLILTLLAVASLQAQKIQNIVHDPVLTPGPGALDPVAPAENAGLLDVTVVADGAATKNELEAVDGFVVMQSFKSGDNTVYFGRFGENSENRVTFSDPTLPDISFTWDPDFETDISPWSGLAVVGTGTPERQSQSSGPTVRGDAVDGDEIWLTGATVGLGKGEGFRYVLTFETPVLAAGFIVNRAEATGRDAGTEGETIWEVGFYDAEDNLLSRQTARPGDDVDASALFGYVALEEEAIAKVVLGDIEEWYLAGGSTGRVFLDDVGFAPAPVGNVLIDPDLAMGDDALDPVAPADDAGLQDITVVADGAASKEELLAVNGAHVLQTFAAGEGDNRVYFKRIGDLDPPYNVVAFTDPELPTITFGWDPDFEGDINVWSGSPLVGSGTPERQSMTSGVTVRGDPENAPDGDSLWLASPTSGGPDGAGFRFTIEFDMPLAAAGFTLPRAEASGRDEGTEAETVWEAGFYDGEGNLLSRQTARPGDGTDIAAQFGYIAQEGEAISKIVIGDIEEWFLSGTSANRMFFDDLLFAVVGAPPPGNRIHDPILASGEDAFDPIAPAENAGLQDITVVADGAATKEELLAIPGFQVMQTFAAGEGDDRVYFKRIGDLDPPYNVVTFSDTELPTIVFGWDPDFEGDINVWSGSPLVGSGTPERQSMTSGVTVRGDPENAPDGDSLWLASPTSGGPDGAGFRFTIEFDRSIAAAGFTLPRAEASGRDEGTEAETVWEAGFYDGEGNLLSRQTARPGDGTDIAAQFGYIAMEGESIRKIVIGDIEEWFLSGTSANRMFFDDLGFVVGEGSGGGEDHPYFLYSQSGGGSLDVVDGNVVFTTPGSGGYYMPIAELPGLELQAGDKLVLTHKVIPGAVTGTSTNNRYGLFSYADTPSGQPTGDIPDAAGADLPGIQVTGYQWTFPMGQVRQEDPRSGEITINMNIRKRRFGLEGEVTDELQGRSGDYISLGLVTVVEPQKSFVQDEEHTIEFTIEYISEESARIGIVLYDSAGEVFGEWFAYDLNAPYSLFDTFAYRDGFAGSSGSPLTILDTMLDIGDADPLPLLPWQDPSLEPGDIVTDPWFGSFEMSTNGWIKHTEQSWLYVDNVIVSTDMWLYSLYLNGWCWSSDAIFPIVYDWNNARYVYYFILEGVVWLYDYSTGEWVMNP